jgi:hypothetical protein
MLQFENILTQAHPNLLLVGYHSKSVDRMIKPIVLPNALWKYLDSIVSRER